MKFYKSLSILLSLLLLGVTFSPINLDLILLSLIIVISMLTVFVDIKIVNTIPSKYFLISVGAMIISGLFFSVFLEGRVLTIVYIVHCIIVIQIAVLGMREGVESRLQKSK